MILLISAPEASPEAYAELRRYIAAISDYVLLPSLGVALLTGLASMAVHQPFQEKGWVWIKALLGILMFKGVLTIVSAKAAYAASMSLKIASGEAPPDALQSLLGLEWGTLIVVMVISILNVVLGVWRPRVMRAAPRQAAPLASREPNQQDAEALRPVAAERIAAE